MKFLPIFFGYLSIVNSSQPRDKEEERRTIGCQQRSTSGRSYAGEANTTVDGIPCQRWSETEPHFHGYTHVGNHNFCRNPNGAPQVWCYTTNPEIRYQYCSVPFCPPLKALDFSLDNDQKPDANNSYTYASLQKEQLPASFTICTAFMVEAWAKYANSYLYVLHDDKGYMWHWVGLFASETFTEFSFKFEDSPVFGSQSEILFYPLQWSRICLSKDSITSELLIEKVLEVNPIWCGGG